MLISVFITSFQRFRLAKLVDYIFTRGRSPVTTITVIHPYLKKKKTQYPCIPAAYIVLSSRVSYIDIMQVIYSTILMEVNSKDEHTRSNYSTATWLSNFPSSWIRIILFYLIILNEKSKSNFSSFIRVETIIDRYRLHEAKVHEGKYVDR